MDLEKKIQGLSEKVEASRKKIAQEEKKIEEWEKELEALRFSRYTMTLKEFNLSDDEFMRFMKQVKRSRERGDIIPPAPTDNL